MVATIDQAGDGSKIILVGVEVAFLHVPEPESREDSIFRMEEALGMFHDGTGFVILLIIGAEVLVVLTTRQLEKTPSNEAPTITRRFITVAHSTSIDFVGNSLRLAGVLFSSFRREAIWPSAEESFLGVAEVFHLGDETTFMGNLGSEVANSKRGGEVESYLLVGKSRDYLRICLGAEEQGDFLQKSFGHQRLRLMVKSFSSFL